MKSWLNSFILNQSEGHLQICFREGIFLTQWLLLCCQLTASLKAADSCWVAAFMSRLGGAAATADIGCAHSSAERTYRALYAHDGRHRCQDLPGLLVRYEGNKTFKISSYWEKYSCCHMELKTWLKMHDCHRKRFRIQNLKILLFKFFCLHMMENWIQKISDAHRSVMDLAVFHPFCCPTTYDNESRTEVM